MVDRVPAGPPRGSARPQYLIGPASLTPSLLRLFVIEGNDAARRLYLRYGFVETGRVERDHARAEREMELRLG